MSSFFRPPLSRFGRISRAGACGSSEKGTGEGTCRASEIGTRAVTQGAWKTGIGERKEAGEWYRMKTWARDRTKLWGGTMPGTGEHISLKIRQWL